MPFSLNDSRTSWKFIAIVMVLGLVVGGGIVWYANTFVSQTESLELPKNTSFAEKFIDSTIPPDLTAGWQTYRNEGPSLLGATEPQGEFGFEVKYPENWWIPPIAYAGITFVILSEKEDDHASDYAWVRIDRSNPHIRNIRDISYCESRALEENDPRCEKLNIGNQLVIVDWKLDDTTAQVYVQDHPNQKEVNISYHDPAGIDQTGHLLFKEILSTFRFVE